MHQLHDELPADEFAKLAGLIFTGANTISRLLRTRRDLSREEAEHVAGAFADALDDIGTQLNLPL